MSTADCKGRILGTQNSNLSVNFVDIVKCLDEEGCHQKYDIFSFLSNGLHIRWGIYVVFVNLFEVKTMNSQVKMKKNNKYICTWSTRRSRWLGERLCIQSACFTETSVVISMYRGIFIDWKCQILAFKNAIKYGFWDWPVKHWSAWYSLMNNFNGKRYLTHWQQESLESVS